MNKEIISLQTVVFRDKAFLAADIDEEKAMMNIDKGKYYGLNAVASRIWDLLVHPITVKSLIDYLMKEFQVEEEICLNDVSAFLNKMHEEGLVSLV